MILLGPEGVPYMRRRERKNPRLYRAGILWCAKGDSNPHILRTLDPESSLSTNFSTRALKPFGATHGTRTHDPRITNAMLYQLS